MKKTTWLSYPYLIWMLMFTIIPMLIVLFFSLTKTVDGNIHFTFEHFKEAFKEPFLSSLLKSLWIAFRATFYCFIIGYPIALFLTKLKPLSRSIIKMMIMVPMWMNFLIRTYAWMAIFRGGDAGLINSLLINLGLEPVQFLYNDTAVILAMIYNYLPFMILPLCNSLEKIEPHIIEASHDLGASNRKVFTTIQFPLSIPGIISGITMVFLPAVTTFAIPKLVGGSSPMIGDLIEKQFLQLNNKNLGSAIAIIMMVLIIGSMLLFNKFDKDKDAGGVL